jgi:hypothetical protein
MRSERTSHRQHDHAPLFPSPACGGGLGRGNPLPIQTEQRYALPAAV